MKDVCSRFLASDHWPRPYCIRIMIWGAALFFLTSAAGFPGTARSAVGEIDFTQFSLEELKNVKISSASKRPERLSEVPAAVYVITQEDIRRSGATSIPELLRMVPGVQVARISATEWAVNIRGLNELFSNKLLVLIDGRSIYTHVFSGVFWDIRDTVLEDIERIEVIRGPGASIWGSNAVNGVINIITKSARNTRGGELTALAGTEEGIGTLRYGDVVGSDAFYRVYAKYFVRGKLFEEERDIQNDPSKSDWHSGRAGFRMDWRPHEGPNTYTFEGGGFYSQYDNELDRIVLTPPYFVEEEDTARAGGGHFLSRWTHRISSTSSTALQFFYDYLNKDFDGGNVRTHTADLEFQHHFRVMERNDLIWGLNWRFISDRFDESIDISTDPASEDYHLFSAFLQDRIQVFPDRFSLILGAKFEHNEYTGLDVQPSARFLWTPRERHTFWGAISRAVRVPSRIEHDGVISGFVFPPQDSGFDRPVILQLRGESGLEAETLIAYELGYRFQPAKPFWLHVASFYNDYDRLIAVRLDGRVLPEIGADNQVIIPTYFDNNFSGESYGFEVSAFWQATDFWRLQAAYTFLETELHQKIPDVDAGFQNILLFEGANPRNQVSLRSDLDLTDQLELNLWYRYVDRLSENDVDSYATLDARLAWAPLPDLELAVVGQNLFEQRHSEFSSLEVERSVYFKADWLF
jgi:iron complex outermembrane recepter protein